MLWSKPIGITFSVLSLILVITGQLTDYWLVNFGSNLFHQGLWQICTKNDCEKLEGIEYIDATRGILVFSTAILLVGIVCYCLSFNNIYVGKISASMAAAILHFLSAIFLLIGMSIYTGETISKVTNNSLNYQWSFYLCWTAILTTILSGICMTLAQISSPNPGYEAV